MFFTIGTPSLLGPIFIVMLIPF